MVGGWLSATYRMHFSQPHEYVGVVFHRLNRRSQGEPSIASGSKAMDARAVAPEGVLHGRLYDERCGYGSGLYLWSFKWQV
jgi:hypothetical protein